MSQNHLIIGLTGLLGSGKSTVAKLFAQLDVRIIDTDIIARQLTQVNGSAINPIANLFGKKFIANDGKLDRELMRELIFSDKNARIKLEKILHPLIFDQVLHELNQNTESLYSIIVVPLLFSNPQYLALTKRNVFIDAPYDLIIERVILRSKLTKVQIDNILGAQLSREEQLSTASNIDIVYNDGNLIYLHQQVDLLNKRYLLLR